MRDMPKAPSTKAPSYSGKEWSLWSLKFEMWTKVNSLWPYISGIAQVPPEVTPTTQGTIAELEVKLHKRSVYLCQMDRAYEALISAMENPDYLRLVAEFKSRGSNPPRVADAWKRLKAAHFVVQETSFLKVRK